MTSTRIEATSRRSEGRPASQALSMSVASGEIFGIHGANRAGGATAVDNVPPSRHHDGGQIPMGGFDPADRQMPVRHLVIFPARVL
jgi:ABC-type uncharacterized transport system ATPase subunit